MILQLQFRIVNSFYKEDIHKLTEFRNQQIDFCLKKGLGAWFKNNNLLINNNKTKKNESVYVFDH